MLLGGGTTSGATTFTECSEIRLKNTLEVALVLDNSGSMNELGSGTGARRIDLLKTAAKQLVDTLALQQMKQVSKPVQFSLVPFAASVNVGPTHDMDSWMDEDGISPIQHEDFDWAKMTAAEDPDKYAEKLNGVWYQQQAVHLRSIQDKRHLPDRPLDHPGIYLHHQPVCELAGLRGGEAVPL